MANYSLVSTSKFQPFSFERYMQPIQIYAQLYEQEKAALEQQAMQYGLLSNMVDPEIDRDVYEAMQAYNDNLLKQRDILSSVGLTPQGRRELSELRQQYFTNVAPIDTWVKQRNADIEAQRNLELQSNGNIRFTKRAAETPLSYYRSGKPLDYKVMNLNAAMAETSSLIQAISKRRVQTGQRSLGDYMESYKTTGYANLAELMADPEAKAAIETVLTKYGFNSDDFTDEDRAALYNAVQEGVNGGLAYDVTSQFTPNWREQANVSLENSKELEQFKSELDEASGTKFTGYNEYGNPTYKDKDGDYYEVLPDGTKVYYKVDDSDADSDAIAAALGLDTSGSSKSKKSGSKKNETTADQMSDYLPQDATTLQLAPPNGGPKEAKNLIENLKGLGIAEDRDKSGNIKYGKIRLDHNTSTGKITRTTKGSGNIGSYDIFDSKTHKLLTKEQFLTHAANTYVTYKRNLVKKGAAEIMKNQNISEEQALTQYWKAVGNKYDIFDDKLKKQFADFYDREVAPKVAAINASDNGKRNTVSELYKRATERSIYGNNSNIKVIPIRFAENVEEEILDDLIGTLPDQKITRLTGSVFDYQTKNKRDDADKFQARLAKPRGEEHPSIQMYIVNSKDPYTGNAARGILVKSGGETWFIPSDNLSNLVKTGFDTWNSEQMASARALLSKYENAGNDRMAELYRMQIENLGSEGLRNILQGIGLKYDIPSAKAYKQEQ